MATVVKTVRIDLSISGDAASKQKLDSISARAEELKKAFPEYKIKIDSQAASAKLAVFRADMKAVADAASKPVDIQVVTDKATAKLAAMGAKAEELKRKWPDYKITIDDKLAKAKMDLLAVESKLVGDKISKNLSGAGGGGIFSKIGGLVSGAGSSAVSSVAGLPWPAIAGITAAAAAAIPVLASLATVAVGAGAGLAAFAAVGAGAYGKLSSDISALHTANENFQQSALNVDTALKASALDTKIYDAALKGMPPGMAQAAKLLGDQNVRWQDLSQSQQNNVVALANNKAAVKSLLPSQAQALTALIAGKKAWDDMSPGQQAAAKGLQAVSSAWSKLTTAMAPAVLAVIAEAAGLVTKAIGPIGVIAKEATPGIKQMVGILGGSFITFLKGIQPLIGPSMGAFNSILTSVTGSLNKGLVPAMVAGMPNFVKLAVFTGKATGAVIDFVGALFRVSSWMINAGAKNLHDLAVAIDFIRVTAIRAFKIAADTFLGFVRIMLGGLLTITSVMARLPGPLGAPWRAMSGELRTAIGWVGGLKKSVDALPTSKRVGIYVAASGAGTITFAQQIAGQNARGYLAFHSKGARIPGYGGGDTYPAMLEGGESVVPKHLTPAVAPFLKAHGVPGFAGGLIGARSPEMTAVPWVAGREGSAGYAAATSFGQGILASMHKLVAAASAAAAAAFSSGPAAFGSALAAQNFARSLLPSYGWSAQWPALLNLWNRESGWNANAVNPSSGAYGIPQCYSTDMMILTRRGWLKHNEVQVGDETVGYNQATGRSEWTRITAVLHPGVHPVVRYGNSQAEFTTTPNHRWLMREKRVRATRPAEQMRQIQDRLTDSILILAKPHHAEDGLPITMEEAALLGWIAGDGWERKAYARYGTSRGGGTAGTFHIGQTKQENWLDIERALAGHGNVVRTRERTVHGEPRLDREWRLSAPYARDLAERAGNPKNDHRTMVLAMSSAQRKAWLDAMFLAEGSVDSRTAHRSISQNDGALAETIRLAIYLEGYRPSVYKRADQRYGTENLIIGFVKPTLHVGHPGFFYEEAGEQEVWCVTTELGSFTAEQNGHIHLTGNSLGHGHPYNLGDYANQIRWGLSYIKGRYGGPNQAWFHELSSGWYDQGGFLPTGLSLAYNGTGRPEPVGGGGGNTYHVTVNMPFGSTRAEVENGLVKALDSLNHQRRLPRAP